MQWMTELNISVTAELNTACHSLVDLEKYFTIGFILPYYSYLSQPVECFFLGQAFKDKHLDHARKFQVQESS